MKPVLVAKIINVLPKKVSVLASRMLINKYISKYANLNLIGSENLKGIRKPTIFICNHLSNADGLILAEVLKEIDPTFVAGVKLSKDKVTNLGMNVVKTTNIKPNTADKDGIKRIIDLVKSGESILIFPEGTRSRVGSMIEAKRGILLIARMTKAPIVPIGIAGTEKLLPISKDGDMGSESFHHADVMISIGKQFDLPVKDKEQGKKEFEEFAMNKLMKNIATLLPEEYRGYYI